MTTVQRTSHGARVIDTEALSPTLGRNSPTKVLLSSVGLVGEQLGKEMHLCMDPLCYQLCICRVDLLPHDLDFHLQKRIGCKTDSKSMKTFMKYVACLFLHILYLPSFCLL